MHPNLQNNMNVVNFKRIGPLKVRPTQSVSYLKLNWYVHRLLLLVAYE